MYTRENDFSRTMYNEAKLGAYYTDTEHCKSLRPLFNWTGSFNAIDPSIGDGAALIETVGKGNELANLYGVELNDKTVEETRENPYIKALVQGDFTTDLLCTKNVFDFVFTNPPYIEVEGENGKKERMEQHFLDNIGGNASKEGIIKKGGILVAVVNYNFFSSRSTLRYLVNRFDILHVWKFRPEEYAKFHQIVVVARRCSNKVTMVDEMDKIVEKYDSVEKIEELPLVLPDDLVGTVDVPCAQEGALKRFTTKAFDAGEAFDFLLNANITGDKQMDDMKKWESKKLSEKAHSNLSIGRPPIMPGDGVIYTAMVGGAGNGITGDEGVDMHLQEGISTKVESCEYVPDTSNPENEIAKVVTSTKIKMKILEIVEDMTMPNGVRTYITTLE